LKLDFVSAKAGDEHERLISAVMAGLVPAIHVFLL
jgi:hypothetical protein